LSRKTRVLVEGFGEAAIRSPPPTPLSREATLDSFPKVSGHSEGMKVIDGKKYERKEPHEEEWDRKNGRDYHDERKVDQGYKVYDYKWQTDNIHEQHRQEWKLPRHWQ